MRTHVVSCVVQTQYKGKQISFDHYFYLFNFTDEQITSLSQQSLMSSLGGNSVKCLQLSIRLSVCEGVQQIYQQLSDKKWTQVIIISFNTRLIFRLEIYKDTLIYTSIFIT